MNSNTPTVRIDPCYDRLATLRATGANMAAAMKYECGHVRWSAIHPDFTARRIIEFAFLETVFDHQGEAELARIAKARGAEIAARGGFI